MTTCLIIFKILWVKSLSETMSTVKLKLNVLSLFSHHYQLQQFLIICGQSKYALRSVVLFINLNEVIIKLESFLQFQFLQLHRLKSIEPTAEQYFDDVIRPYQTNCIHYTLHYATHAYPYPVQQFSTHYNHFQGDQKLIIVKTVFPC